MLPENIHITLKFLGNTDETLIESIREVLHKKISPYPPFYIKIAGVGYFPGGRHPRVIWVGLEDTGILQDIHKDIDKEMTRFGYQPETRPFSPHITIGRVRSARKMTEGLKKLEELRAVSFDDVYVKGLSLMKSELKPSGAQYFSLAEIPFEGGNDVD